MSTTTDACRSLHDLAMTLAEHADRRRGDDGPDGARLAFQAAAAAEYAAGLLATREPSRGILLRSAAWLALQGGASDLAVDYAMTGLRQLGAPGVLPPDPVAGELDEVLTAARKAVSEECEARLARERREREADPDRCSEPEKP